MKNYITYLLATVSIWTTLTSCSHKSIPTASTNNHVPATTTAPSASTHQPKVDSAISITPVTPINKDTLEITAAAPVAAAKIYTAVDSKGKVYFRENNLPVGTFGIDSLKSLRAFTPNQAQTLAYRYKMIPPRALYVPDALSKKGSRGVYYIYNKKFWYWRKSDGFFYLDTNYYKQ